MWPRDPRESLARVAASSGGSLAGEHLLSQKEDLLPRSRASAYCPPSTGGGNSANPSAPLLFPSICQFDSAAACTTLHFYQHTLDVMSNANTLLAPCRIQQRWLHASLHPSPVPYSCISLMLIAPSLGADRRRPTTVANARSK